MMKPVGTRILMAVVAALIVSGNVSQAETAREILDRRKALDDTTRHWDDRHQRMRLKIIDSRGGERARELDLFERRYPGDERKGIVFFLSPAELRGTGFLAFNHGDRPTDQWLYLPALKRVRQITANIRSQSFVGTDFSYHDLDILNEMSTWTEADTGSSLRGEETLGSTPCHVIELTPKRDDVDYKYIVLWLGREDLEARQVQFFETRPSDAAAPPKKRVRQDDLRMVGAFPVAYRVEMETPAANTRTTMEVLDVQFNQGLSDDQFTQRSLERGV